MDNLGPNLGHHQCFALIVFDSGQAIRHGNGSHPALRHVGDHENAMGGKIVRTNRQKA
jgi:hypothetical protein